jgi:hypothetical protein
VPKIDSASGRRASRNTSEIIALEGARPQASPAPIRKRALASCQMLPTKPVMMVIKLQNAKPSAMMFRRLKRSASQAIGTPSSE